MIRKFGAIALLGLAAFMALGFFLAEPTTGVAAQVAGFVIAVVLPAAFGIGLLRSAPGGNAARVQRLRAQTIDAEILRLAMAQKGRLTAVEITSALGLAEADVASALDGMMRREVADMDVSDDGVLVYTFHDAKYFEGKREDRRLLDG